MPVIDLLKLFQSLVIPVRTVTGSALAAVPIPGSSTHRLATDASGSPCLLIHQAEQAKRPAPIRLENLQVSFVVPCNVIGPSGQQDRDTFTIVRCVGGNPDLFPHFLRIVAPLIGVLGPMPTPAAVRRAIAGLVELFQALSAPSRKTIQGLWAELLLIRLASNPQAMVAAWHGVSEERFDFAAGVQRIEVKSCSSRRREHHFSLEQLAPSRGAQIVVASVFAERTGGGLSLQDLFEQVRHLLAKDSSLLNRLDAVFYSCLGSAWADGMSEAFDRELAVQSLSFYAAEAIPRPDNPAPQQVTDIRFRSDLGSVPPIPGGQLRKLGGLFEASAP